MNFTEQQAERDGEVARRWAFIHDILHLITGEPNELVPFDAVRGLRPYGEHYRGIQVIPVENIIGSVDRYRDFDQMYFPKTNHLAERWVNVRRLRLEGKELPPISVYQVGETYFVKDGNHRVSVAHMDGQKYIDAEVIELDVPVAPEIGDNLKDLILKGEYASFLEQTGLHLHRPEHELVGFSVLGRYDILLEHIKTRQYFMGANERRQVTWEEAVLNWYDELYLKMIQSIRAARVLDKFPGRTEADLYLWIMDHRYYLSQQDGRDVGATEAAEDFKRHYHPAWYKRLWVRASNWLWQGWERLFNRRATRVAEGS
jgi:hypothetical protein